MLSTPKYVGEPSVESLASGLATLGRYGDEYMVHAAEGETVIPKEILDSNPQLKRDLFRQMMMMGIQDPNRYVVGSSLNSINPVTGQPEFFFKKIFKAVKKVFKKALPVIAPIVGNIIAPGIGGIIASGLVTKLQGGSWGDALKSAGMAMAGQGLMGGISGAMSKAPGATFFGGLQQGLTTPFTAASNLFSSGPLNPLSQGIFGSSKSLAGAGLFGKLLTPRYNPNATAIVDPSFGLGAAATPSTPALDGFVEGADAQRLISTAPISDAGASAAGTLGGDFVTGDYGIAPSSAESADALLADVSGGGTKSVIVDPREFSSVSDRTVAPTIKQSVPTTTQSVPAIEQSGEVAADSPDRSFFDRYINPSKEAANLNRIESFNADYANEVKMAQATGRTAPTVDDYWKTWAPKNPEAGFLRRIAPIGIAGAAGIGALTGAFDFEEEEQEFLNKNFDEASKEMQAYDEWKKIPASQRNSPQAQSLYFKWHGQPNRTRSQFEYLTGGRSSRPDWMFLPEMSQEYRAMGGEVIGPGTGTSDSIPARLSDGEFVMTADAVRNAGGGDRNLGAARMYDMMRRFEGGTA